MTLKFVVTAPARSGTKYVAHLLTMAGISCGHEDVFNSWGVDLRTVPDWEAAELDGDSSYNAAPFLPQLEGVHVVHLVRPPLDQIRSAVGTGEVDNLRTWVRFIHEHTGILDVPPGPERAAAYWVGWNRLIEDQADVVWPLAGIDAGAITDLAKEIGVKVTKAEATKALEGTPTNINHRSRDESVGLGDLGGYADEVVALAEAYGVPLETTAEEAEAAAVELERPPGNGSRGDWANYVTALGGDPGDLGRDDLIELADEIQEKE